MCLPQENIDHHQSELSSVLSKGKTDVLDKQKRIKQLRREIDEMAATKNDIENHVLEKRNELANTKEKIESANQNLHKTLSDVARWTSCSLVLRVTF